MKNVIKFLPLAAIVLAGGLAMATTKKMNAHNVYWDGNEWQPLTLQPDQYECEGAGWCTGYEDENGEVSDKRPGEFIPLP